MMKPLSEHAGHDDSTPPRLTSLTVLTRQEMASQKGDLRATKRYRYAHDEGKRERKLREIRAMADAAAEALIVVEMAARERRARGPKPRAQGNFAE